MYDGENGHKPSISEEGNTPGVGERPSLMYYLKSLMYHRGQNSLLEYVGNSHVDYSLMACRFQNIQSPAYTSFFKFKKFGNSETKALSKRTQATSHSRKKVNGSGTPCNRWHPRLKGPEIYFWLYEYERMLC